jgi:hypothetical protein
MAGAPSSSACCTKGFSISSLPSRGEMRTRRVPRATRRPRGREEVLPSSSGLGLALGGIEVDIGRIGKLVRGRYETQEV